MINDEQKELILMSREHGKKETNQLNSTAILVIKLKNQKYFLKTAEFQGFFGLK